MQNPVQEHLRNIFQFKTEAKENGKDIRISPFLRGVSCSVLLRVSIRRPEITPVLPLRPKTLYLTPTGSRPPPPPLYT